MDYGLKMVAYLGVSVYRRFATSGLYIQENQRPSLVVQSRNCPDYTSNCINLELSNRISGVYRVTNFASVIWKQNELLIFHGDFQYVSRDREKQTAVEFSSY